MGLPPTATKLTLPISMPMPMSMPCPRIGRLPALSSLLLACAAPASAAQSCDSLVAEIDAKIRAAGVASFTLKTAEVAEVLPGQVVGNCAGKKIVYQKTGSTNGAAPPSAAASAAKAKAAGGAKAPAPPLLTECKDGTMAVGATCGR